MRKKWKLYGLSVCVFCYLAGCGRLTKGEPAEMPAVPTENSEHWEAQTEMEREISEEAQQQEGRTAELKDIAGMVGMEDKDTAGLFGGGEENWTEDRSFYIGRSYEAELYGRSCQIYTLCGEEKTVESVSVWAVSGDREVTETETEEWKNRITDFMGVEPAADQGISEGGSQNFRWTSEGKIVSMHRMKDILTISFHPAVGELK